jgi:phage terminase large subunit
MESNVDVVPKTFRDLQRLAHRFNQFQGGTRSGKTYTILQFIAIMCYTSAVPIVWRAFRKYSATHSKSTIPDFEAILISMAIPFKVNKTDKVYTLGKSLVCFDGCDDPQKLRGVTQDYAYINEANELTEEDFSQINFRTRQYLVLDFNPSMLHHWIYQLRTQQPDDVAVYYSTFRDNPFLGEEQRRAILALKHTNPARWRVYGLGEKATAEESIYPLWEPFTFWPDRCKDRVFGLDFGMTVPTALVEVSVADNELYAQQHLYETNVTTSQLIARIRNVVGKATVYCDAAEPDRIAELQAAGINATKGRKDVQAGISYVQGKAIRIHATSNNLQSEINGYAWQRNRATNQLLDEPVKTNDHALDALRYAAYTHWGIQTKTKSGHNARANEFTFGHQTVGHNYHGD